jgi:hypothetical protein
LTELEARKSAVLAAEWRRREEDRQTELKLKMDEIEKLAEELKIALK